MLQCGGALGTAQLSSANKAESGDIVKPADGQYVRGASCMLLPTDRGDEVPIGTLPDLFLRPRKPGNA